MEADLRGSGPRRGEDHTQAQPWGQSQWRGSQHPGGSPLKLSEGAAGEAPLQQEALLKSSRLKSETSEKAWLITGTLASPLLTFPWTHWLPLSSRNMAGPFESGPFAQYTSCSAHSQSIEHCKLLHKYGMSLGPDMLF